MGGRSRQHPGLGGAGATFAAVSSEGPGDIDQVLERARCGDESAWAALYDGIAPQVLGYVRVRGATDAEEVLGDVFLHVARGIDEFEGDASKFRSWVFVIATSRLYDERRRLRRKPTDPLDAGAEERLSASIDIEAEVEQAAAAEEVRELLDVLTADQRAVIELRVFADLTSQEVADIVGKPTGAVKALYRRGLGSLRRELEQRGAQPAGRPGLLPFPGGAVPLGLQAAVTRGS